MAPPFCYRIAVPSPLRRLFDYLPPAGPGAAALKPEAVVLHPGPVNRGLELSPEVADGQRSLILEQVENGVAVRKAILEAVS